MTHQMIRRFQLEGQVNDAKLGENRSNLEWTLEGIMRDSNFVPILDLPSSWSTWYDEQEEQMHFILTMHGVYVGEEAWTIDGVMGQKKIPKSTPHNKSKQS